jgi:hypothetical protein
MSPRLRRALVYGLFTTAWLGGCSVIVPSDVPEYRCSGNDPSSCPSGMVCDAISLLCVSPTPEPDAPDEVPEEGTGEDSGADHDGPNGPSALGGECVIDADCEAGLLCGGSTILTTAVVPANTRVCTKPCCTSANCAAGFVCFPAATGGNYCVAAAKADRTPPGVGGKGGGETCAGHTACRSGLCTAGRCVDTCCDPDQCAAGTTCRISTVNAHAGWACGVPAGGATKEVNESCSQNSDCKNDNCVQPFAALRCTPPCCRATDCTSLGLANNVCAYGQAGNDYIKWCFGPNAAGQALGATCNSNNECASRYCDSELGRCANVCCTNSDCASGESCKPSPGSTPFLRCVKNR